MRLLITGGAGFLGSHLCDRFIRKKHRVLAVDNFLTGSRENIRHFSGDKNFSLIKHDITKPLSVPGTLDAVLHFASPASPPDYMKYTLETLWVGAKGSENALRIAKAKKAVFMLASTSEVYGDPLQSPQTESYWGNVNSVGPRSVYDEAKRFAEALTMAYSRKFKLKTRIIRIFNTYGERMRAEDGRVIPNFISQALSGRPLTVYGSGKQTRSYCYVDDLVSGIEKALFSGVSTPINLGNPNEKSVLDLARLIIQMTRSKSKIVLRPLPEDDPKQRLPDITLAKKALQWEPKVPLREGLIRTIHYFKTQRHA